MSYFQRQYPQLPEVVLGGIPLIRSSHFRELGQEYWRGTSFSFYSAPHDLERLQRLLHTATEAAKDEGEGKENTIVLVSKYTRYGRINDVKIPYHDDILPRWEGTFCFCLVWLGSLSLGRMYCVWELTPIHIISLILFRILLHT